MTAYSPSQHTHNPSLGQALTFRPEANGSVTVTLPPALVSTIGNLAMAVMQASGLTVVPEGYTPPPTDEELAQQERLERLNKDREGRKRSNRKIGRIVTSQHRKLMLSQQLEWYPAIKQISENGVLSHDGNRLGVEALQDLMRLHKRARTKRIEKFRFGAIIRLASQGLTNTQIAERIGGHPKSIGKWRKEALANLTSQTKRGSE